MSHVTTESFAELKHSLDTAIGFLQTVREPHWTGRLKGIRERMDTDLMAGVDGVLAAFQGDHGFDRLYLSGPRNGHNLSERQEIEANGKLHVIQAHMLGVAKAIKQSAANG
jgi:hypothetical protein